MSPNVPYMTYIRRYHVAQDILNKKRAPVKYLAQKYECSERTIKRDVAWIRNETDLPSIQSIVADKVVGALEHINCQEDKKFIIANGLPFLARGLPQKTELTGTVKEIKLVWHVNPDTKHKISTTS